MNTSSLRKAAVLIRSLDADSAARLLARLTPQDAHVIREALRGVGDIDDRELTALAQELQQFHTAAAPQEERDPRELLGKLDHEGQRMRALRAPDERFNAQLAELRQLAASAPSNLPVFQKLLHVETRTLAECLEREHAQTVAVVLSHLPVEKASAVLDLLPGEQQTEVIQRLSEIEETDPESLCVIEQNLAAWLATQHREKNRRNDRMTTVRSIMAAAQDRTRQAILLRLRRQDRPLARQIESKISETLPHNRLELQGETNRASDRAQLRRGAPAIENLDVQFSFDDLAILSTLELTTVLRTIEPETVRCAFWGASDQLLERVNHILTRRQRRLFKRQLQSIGPIRLRDVEAARRAITDNVTNLIKQGAVKLPAHV